MSGFNFWPVTGYLARYSIIILYHCIIYPNIRCLKGLISSQTRYWTCFFLNYHMLTYNGYVIWWYTILVDIMSSLNIRFSILLLWYYRIPFRWASNALSSSKKLNLYRNFCRTCEVSLQMAHALLKCVRQATFNRFIYMFAFLSDCQLKIICTCYWIK